MFLFFYENNKEEISCFVVFNLTLETPKKYRS